MSAEAKLRALLAAHADRVADEILAIVPELVRERLSSLLDGQAAPPPAPPRKTRAAKQKAKPQPKAAKSPASKPVKGSPMRDRVVALHKAGKRNPEIAAALDTSVHAIEVHVSAARKAGLLPPSGRKDAAKPSAAATAPIASVAKPQPSLPPAPQSPRLTVAKAPGKPDRFALIEKSAKARRGVDEGSGDEWDNPCRDPNCGRRELHAAHGAAA